MNDDDRILRLDCWTLTCFFCSCLGSGAIVSSAFTGSGWFFWVVLGELGLGYVLWLLGCGVDSKFCFNTVHWGFLRYQELQRGRVH